MFRPEDEAYADEEDFRFIMRETLIRDGGWQQCVWRWQIR